MRRHYSNYFKGVSHFKEYRTRLVSTMDEKEIYAILDEVAETFGEYAFQH
jgi:tRNA-dihydrouridine synthase B